MTVKITDIQVINTAPEGINLTVVKVLTSEPGLYGYGDATFAYRWRTVTSYVLDYLKPLLVGRSVAEITELWNLMHNNSYWRDGAIENIAIAGVDIALWDIKGKMAGMPVYDLLGGAVRAAVPVYRHVDGASVDEIADGIYLDSREYIIKTVDLFEKLRAKVGFGIDFVHDVHERIQPSEAAELARLLEPCRLFYLEDPLPLSNLECFRELRARTVTPIAEGELFNNASVIRPLVVNHLIDFIRVHVPQLGGITPCRKLALFCSEFGVRTAWHGPGDLSPVGHAANIHLDMASENFGVQEWSGIEPPNFVIQKLRTQKGALLEVFHGMPEFKDGFVYASDKPGLGIEVDEKAAARFPNTDEVTTWTMTRGRDGSLVLP